MKTSSFKSLVFLSLIFTLIAVALLEPKPINQVDTGILSFIDYGTSQHDPISSCEDLQDSHPCHFGHCSFFAEEQFESNAPKASLSLSNYRFFVPVRFPEPLGQPPDQI